MAKGKRFGMRKKGKSLVGWVSKDWKLFKHEGIIRTPKITEKQHWMSAYPINTGLRKVRITIEEL